MKRYYTQPIDQLQLSDYSNLVSMALLEDCPNGDITSESIFLGDDQCRASLVPREEGIFCGMGVVSEICKQTGNTFTYTFYKKDGDSFVKNVPILKMEGNLNTILRVERILLNFIQYLSGISTQTNSLVKRYNQKLMIFDTRKTLPGYRKLAKYAVYTGGGANHRLDLSDMAMIKDNHVAMAGSIEEAVSKIRNKFPDKKIEVEVDSISQIEEVVRSKAEIILLDNFTIEDTIVAIKKIKTLDSTLLIECSGGITPEKLEALSQFEGIGVSMGYLTHTTKFLDLSLEVERI
ncbi:MAG: carboxylating nicotinate-nucleotide diphosphorylase [Leptospiraceae bacterium]|nr:carboxylating nicotinate-nucleotide diphosphorylase [Leptospiraceae bacterium]MCK6381817.1 carboxylating nicotinate-nucleotide diphosphorylase [Leptospiraceae bacterium]NUM40957.1 carboxylating nicotinate-nucleotide diphosphorylase [Leptospiraceae bacterium]